MKAVAACVLFLSSVFVLGQACKDHSTGEPHPDPHPNPAAAGWRSGIPCANDLACEPLDPGAPACTTFYTKCDLALPRVCLVKLKSGKQCAEGHVRGTTLANNTSAIEICDPATCDFKPAAACGGSGQKCCVGGCLSGKCSSLVGATGSSCP